MVSNIFFYTLTDFFFIERLTLSKNWIIILTRPKAHTCMHRQDLLELDHSNLDFLINVEFLIRFLWLWWRLSIQSGPYRHSRCSNKQFLKDKRWDGTMEYQTGLKNWEIMNGNTLWWQRWVVLWEMHVELVFCVFPDGLLTNGMKEKLIT